MKQSAVEELKENILQIFATEEELSIINKAKEMEKQQQEKFAIDFFNWCKSKDAEDLLHDLIMLGEVDKNPTTLQLLETFRNK